MTCSLSWNRKDENGKKFQIEFQLIKNQADWKAKRVRFDPRETYEPEPEDWDELIAQMEKNLRRGKVYPKDLDIVRDLKKRMYG